jgi:hypothetical protein
MPQCDRLDYLGITFDLELREKDLAGPFTKVRLNGGGLTN